MRLTKVQILKIAQAVMANGAQEFEITQQEDGKLRIYAVRVVEKQEPIALGKIKVEEEE